MFKPIKDLITYIQNASTSGTETVASNDDETNTTNLSSEVNLEAPEVKSTPKMENCDVKIETSGFVATANTAKNEASTYDDDEGDIELQIKSSIMVRKSLNATKTTELSTKPSRTTSTPDFNQNLKENLKVKTTLSSRPPDEDDELADFKNDPLQSSNEDYCSVGSEVDEDVPLQSAEETADELQTEDEDTAEETFVDLHNSEIIVVNDSELNSSIASSTAEDPLAIDVSTVSTCDNVTSNPLDSSSTNDEASASGENHWFDNDNKSSALRPAADVTNVTIRKKQVRQDNISGQTEDIAVPAEELERNDNSDSGLGIETSAILLQTTINNSINEPPSPVAFKTTADEEVEVEESKLTTANDIVEETKPIDLPDVAKAPAVVLQPKPLRSNLKRRFCDVPVDEQSDKAAAATDAAETKDQDAFPPKKPKRSINFESVHVYYFPRQQGFGCIPSAGGCTLGMGAQHVDTKTLTLAEHAAELRRAHRLHLQEVNPRGSSSEETDESEEDYLSEGSGSDADSNGFLQPVPPKQRRAILKAAGVRKIDTSEKAECRTIRNSREVCGCTCRDFCDPETCGCSRAGIKCQVDRSMFPCGCSRDACGNTTGRVEFNPNRVRTHFIHTIMRLEMENRQQQPPNALNGHMVGGGYDTSGTLMPLAHASMPPHTMTSGGVVGSGAGSSNSYYNMQPQSNYSSGYASPAYPNDPAANYYQHQQQSMLYSNTTEIHQHPATNALTQYHGLDNIDGGLFTGVANTAPSYGELLPNYCANNANGPISNGNAASTSYHHNMSYAPSYMTAYQHHHVEQQQQHLHATTTTSYLPPPTQHNASNNSGYSSCAVPSLPPYGTATTCSSPTATIGTTSDNFISLSSPIASSSRLSQINDLLQHNRNTTAALVAVSRHSGNSSAVFTTAKNCVDSNLDANTSIETPPISETQKGCFVFESELTMTTLSSLPPISNIATPVPIEKPPQSEPPPTTAKTPPSPPLPPPSSSSSSIDYAAGASYTI